MFDDAFAHGGLARRDGRVLALPRLFVQSRTTMKALRFGK